MFCRIGSSTIPVFYTAFKTPGKTPPPGRVRWPYLDAPTAPTDERDLAAIAVRTLCEEGHAGAEYVVTGPQSLTQAEQVQTIGRAIGRSLRVEEMSPDDVVDVLDEMDEGKAQELFDLMEEDEKAGGGEKRQDPRQQGGRKRTARYGAC